MSSFTFPHLVGLGGALIVCFDAAASTVSVRRHVEYARFAVGSHITYALVGAVAGSLFGIAESIVAAAVVGFLEATVGWRVSWKIGAGRIDPAYLTPLNIARTILLVTALAAVIGGAAGIGAYLATS